MSVFGTMKDPRTTSKGNLRHQLVDIVFLVFSAVVSGCNDWDSIEIFGNGQIDWLRKFYPYKNGIPSHDTLNRVFSNLETKVFTEKFIEWTQILNRLSDEETVAIDGKTIRGSYDKNKGQSAFHIVSAYAHGNRLCLGQVETKEKSNEITAIPELLELIDIKNATVTADAMACQKEIVSKIREKEAHYVIAVKSNQKSLETQIEKLFKITKPSSIATELNNNHGRVETRKCFVINNFDFFDDYEEWTDLKGIVKIETERYIKSTQKTSYQTRYYITSHSGSAEKLNHFIRNHWSIENNLHWMLDVVFQEDKSRRRNKNSASNFNVISKLALALIEKVNSKNTKTKRRQQAAYDAKFRELVLGI